MSPFSLPCTGLGGLQAARQGRVRREPRRSPAAGDLWRRPLVRPPQPLAAAAALRVAQHRRRQGHPRRRQLSLLPPRAAQQHRQLRCQRPRWRAHRAPPLGAADGPRAAVLHSRVSGRLACAPASSAECTFISPRYLCRRALLRLACAAALAFPRGQQRQQCGTPPGVLPRALSARAAACCVSLCKFITPPYGHHTLIQPLL